MENISLVDNKVVIDHLSSFEVSISCGVMDDSIHNEANILRLVTSFCNSFTFGVSFSFQFFKILRIKVIISILQEPMNSDRIFIQELSQLCFQSAWKDFKQVGHLLVVLDFTF